VLHPFGQPFVELMRMFVCEVTVFTDVICTEMGGVVVLEVIAELVVALRWSKLLPGYPARISPEMLAPTTTKASNARMNCLIRLHPVQAHDGVLESDQGPPNPLSNKSQGVLQL
jgi:hypothetical protein